jgi:hypothetical protein
MELCLQPSYVFIKLCLIKYRISSRKENILGAKLSLIGFTIGERAAVPFLDVT